LVRGRAGGCAGERVWLRLTTVTQRKLAYQGVGRTTFACAADNIGPNTRPVHELLRVLREEPFANAVTCGAETVVLYKHTDGSFPFIGHLDSLLRVVGRGVPDKYYLIDLKHGAYKPKGPLNEQYRIQLRLYAMALASTADIRVDGAYLICVPQANHTPAVAVEVPLRDDALLRDVLEIVG
jgi:PD-(D/E)XK nuclease superfamily